jgi:hypothetical protein
MRVTAVDFHVLQVPWKPTNEADPCWVTGALYGSQAATHRVPAQKLQSEPELASKP